MERFPAGTMLEHKEALKPGEAFLASNTDVREVCKVEIAEVKKK